MSSVTLNLDEKLVNDANELYKDLGIDFNVAVTIFLKQSLRVKDFPFELSNKETIAAMNEIDKMRTNPKKYKRYSSFKELMNDVFLANLLSLYIFMW